LPSRDNTRCHVQQGILSLKWADNKELGEPGKIMPLLHALIDTQDLAAAHSDGNGRVHSANKGHFEPGLAFSPTLPWKSLGSKPRLPMWCFTF
jgi:hypothetical protein